MNELIVKIRFMFPSLPRAEKAFAQALLDHPEAITQMTLAEIARESESSEASIIRFCKRLGYDGFSALKQEFVIACAEGINLQEDVIHAEDNMKSVLQKVFNSNIQILSDTLILVNDSYDEALKKLIGARSIHFFAVGDAFAACLPAFMKFNGLGIQSTAHSDVMLQFQTAANLRTGDVAIAISYEGRSRNVVQAMSIARQSGATTISITKMNKSPLLKYTDIPLFISTSDLTVGRDKATRRIAEHFILDALYLGFIARSGNDYTRQIKRIREAVDLNKIK